MPEGHSLTKFLHTKWLVCFVHLAKNGNFALTDYTNIDSDMKRTLLSLALGVVFCASAWAQNAPKYVFYFIGDGMGVNQVNAAETFGAAIEGTIGIKPLTFPSFPHVALVNTQSASHGITDSAAGGTALATGRKTYNNAIGVLTDSITPVTSVAVWAKEAGAAVGIATSVSVDHATPACFYAHQKHRKMYAEIGRELVASNFDFFAGSDFLKPAPLHEGEANLYDQARAKGFTIANGYKEFAKQYRKADRMILLQNKENNARDNASIPYALDRKKGDLTLADITRATIAFLQKKNPEKFFCMIEAGKIDWACHNNDAAPMVREVIDADEAVRVAYEFYRQHPEETLILITADHETGGITLGNGGYNLNLPALTSQKISSYLYTTRLKELNKRMGKKFTWDFVRRDLQEYFGFGKSIKLSAEEEKTLHDAFDNLISGKDKGFQSLYASESGLSSAAKQIVSKNAHIGWTTLGHTDGYVPVFAIGAGAEAFHGRIDNTEIPKTIARLAGYPMPEDLQ